MEIPRFASRGVALATALLVLVPAALTQVESVVMTVDGLA